jgi:hypothetical protein
MFHRSTAWGLALLGLWLLPGNVFAQAGKPARSGPAPTENATPVQSGQVYTQNGTSVQNHPVAGAIAVPTSADLPGTLEETLAKAMARNPEIIMAKAKVELAEAEQNAARLDVVRKIIDLWTQKQVLSEEIQSAEKGFANAERLHKIGGVGGEEQTVENAKVALFEARAKLTRAENELHYLIGQGGNDAAKNTSVSTNSDSTHTSGKTFEAARQATAPIQIPRGEAVDKIRQELLKPTQFDFSEQPLSAVIEYLREYHKIEIQIDHDALAEEGLTEDTPITMTVHGVTLAAAFQAFEDRFRFLTFVVRDYGLLLTTPSRAEAKGYFTALEFARASSQPGPLQTPKPMRSVTEEMVIQTPAGPKKVTVTRDVPSQTSPSTYTTTPSLLAPVEYKQATPSTTAAPATAKPQPKPTAENDPFAAPEDKQTKPQPKPANDKNNDPVPK